MACYRIGTHSNAESSKLDGCKSDNIASNASIVFTSERFASEDVSAMHSCTQEIASVGATTRIVFFADTGRTTSVVAANAGNISCDGVDKHERGKFAACQNIIAY